MVELRLSCSPFSGRRRKGQEYNLSLPDREQTALPWIAVRRIQVSTVSSRTMLASLKRPAVRLLSADLTLDVFQRKQRQTHSGLIDPAVDCRSSFPKAFQGLSHYCGLKSLLMSFCFDFERFGRRCNVSSKGLLTTSTSILRGGSMWCRAPQPACHSPLRRNKFLLRCGTIRQR